MDELHTLADPVRRRLLELIAAGPATGVAAGELGAAVQAEFGLTQPAVSRQLRLLREAGFVSVRAVGQRRMYTIEGEPFARIDDWLQRYRRFWGQRLDALETEVRRTDRERRLLAASAPDDRAHHRDPDRRKEA